MTPELTVGSATAGKASGRDVPQPEPMESEAAARQAAVSASLPPALDANSAAMEACRRLRANLAPGRLDAAPPPLLLVGTHGGSERALVTAGLAIALAEEGRTTLLVDADMREPALHHVFAIPRSPGLAEALVADVADALPVPVPVGSDASVGSQVLWILPAGSASRNPAELLRLPSAGRLVEAMARRFQAVIYHTPGQVDYPDALLLAGHVRAAVLVVRLGADTADQLRRVKEPLERAGVSILGFTLIGEASG